MKGRKDRTGTNAISPENPTELDMVHGHLADLYEEAGGPGLLINNRKYFVMTKAYKGENAVSIWRMERDADPLRNGLKLIWGMDVCEALALGQALVAAYDVFLHPNPIVSKKYGVTIYHRQATLCRDLEELCGESQTEKHGKGE